MALDVQEVTGTTAIAAARLSNFSTGGAVPLPAHTAWLDSKVKPLISGNPSAWVDLLGHASRQWKHTGGMNSHQLNRILSFQRCEALKARIAGYGSSVRFNVEFAEGDDQSVMPNPNDGYDRAVEVYVYGSGPPPKRPTAVPPVLATRFEIRVVGGGSASVIAQADDYFFQIVDLTRKKTAFFFYTGAGIGISIPKIPGPGSVTKAGPPTPFTTTRSAELRMFNSTASLYQDAGATFGSYSIGGTMRLTIKEIVDFYGLIGTHPSTIPMSGGWGVQMPGLGSASEGVLALVSGVLPFISY